MVLSPIRITCDAVLLKSGLCIPDKQQLDGAGGRENGKWILWRHLLASQRMSRHISLLVWIRKAQSVRSL